MKWRLFMQLDPFGTVKFELLLAIPGLSRPALYH